MKEIRKKLKQQLLDVSEKYRQTISKQITEQIINSEIFIKSKNIACYIPIDNEIDTWDIIKTIWQQKKSCYLPTLNNNNNNLLFYGFDAQDKLIISENSKYKIPEPTINNKKLIQPQNLDLVIVPLLGFNSEKFRLGRGAGCYDRTFAFKKNNISINPYLLGIGYQWQKIEFTPNTWDIQLNECKI